MKHPWVRALEKLAEELDELYESGLIDDEEYEEQAEIIARLIARIESEK